VGREPKGLNRKKFSTAVEEETSRGNTRDAQYWGLAFIEKEELKKKEERETPQEKGPLFSYD